MTSRPATFAQMYRLNVLECFRLVGPGEGQIVEAHVADQILAETAAQGLWTPHRDKDKADRPTRKRNKTNG
jgi:hypothetical protein